MNGNLELALSWFKVANEDLLAAEHELRYEDAVLRTICFHSQQSVEKYLKGFLISQERAKHTFEIAQEVKNRILRKLNLV
jgi:HEPN domain-containing protein